MNINVNLESSADACGSPEHESCGSPLTSPRRSMAGMTLPALTCKTGGYKRLPGFQAHLGCLISPAGIDGTPIQSIALSSQFGV